MERNPSGLMIGGICKQGNSYKKKGKYLVIYILLQLLMLQINPDLVGNLVFHCRMLT